MGTMPTTRRLLSCVSQRARRRMTPRTLFSASPAALLFPGQPRQRELYQLPKAEWQHRQDYPKYGASDSRAAQQAPARRRPGLPRRFAGRVWRSLARMRRIRIVIRIAAAIAVARVLFVVVHNRHPTGGVRAAQSLCRASSAPAVGADCGGISRLGHGYIPRQRQRIIRRRR